MAKKKRERSILEEQAGRDVLTDFLVWNIGKETADRVVVKVLHPKMRQFLLDNERYVVSKANNLIQVVGAKKGKPYDGELLPEITRCLLRCTHEIEGNRSKESLATEAQLVRARQFAGILAKRLDNSILLPDNPDKFTHGQIGRWLSDARNILIAEGRWDDVNKREVTKESRSSKSKSK